MNRPSFRMGLALGLLSGAAAAIAKAVQSHREASPPPAPAPSTDWPPLGDTTQTLRDTTRSAGPAEAPAVAPAGREPGGFPATATFPVAEPPPTEGPTPAQPSKATAKAPRRSDASAPRSAAARKAPAPRKAAAKAAKAPWVEPDAGSCPASHPVKGKLSSRIFHLPGMMAYDRTNADRCYLDAGAAEADGLRVAKR